MLRLEGKVLLQRKPTWNRSLIALLLATTAISLERWGEITILAAPWHLVELVGHQVLLGLRC
jgi:hypothetical protein